MPNWCTNHIDLSGDLTKFKAWLGDEKLTLNKIDPLPEALASVNGVAPDKTDDEKMALRKEHGADNWYDWRVQNWGTKWDIELDFEDGLDDGIIININFDSAWAPPQAAISTLAAMFPEMNITHAYLEEGVGFVGKDEYIGGERVTERFHEDSNSVAWKQLAVDEFCWEPYEEEAE